MACTLSAERLAELREIVHSASHLVFFGGAGVSTASGIPDFRGTNGLYTESEETDPPEYLLSHTCLYREPEKFYRYYRSSMLYPDAKPNPAHTALAELERRGILRAIITQNIDGLHQAAGSQHVLELHGSVSRNYCINCGKTCGADRILSSSGLPRCPDCGAMIRPDVVLYGEGLDPDTVMEAEKEIRAADVLIAAGSSLLVWPAASYVAGFRGSHLIMINYSETPYDDLADYLIRDSVADVLPALL